LVVLWGKDDVVFGKCIEIEGFEEVGCGHLGSLLGESAPETQEPDDVFLGGAGGSVVVDSCVAVSFGESAAVLASDEWEVGVGWGGGLVV